MFFIIRKKPFFDKQTIVGLKNEIFKRKLAQPQFNTILLRGSKARKDVRMYKIFCLEKCKKHVGAQFGEKPAELSELQLINTKCLLKQQMNIHIKLSNKYHTSR